MKLRELPVLKNPSNGLYVSILQSSLNSWLVQAGTTDRLLNLDASFGDTSECYVKAFQTLHWNQRGEQLIADGIVGPDTWFALAGYSEEIESVQEISAVTIAEQGERKDVVSTLPSVRSEASELAWDTLSIALREIGVTEKGGRNRGERVEQYQTGPHDRNPVPGSPWCASFVSWCVFEAAKELDLSMPFPYSASSRDIESALQAANVYHRIDSISDVEGMIPGDILIWYRCGKIVDYLGHIGFVHHYAKTERILYTIEGNKANRVYAGSYQVRSDKPEHLIRGLLGYARL